MYKLLFELAFAGSIKELMGKGLMIENNQEYMTAIKRAFELGQQSNALPVVTVGDAATHKAKPDPFLDTNWKPMPDAPEYMRNDAGQLIRVLELNEKRG